MHCLRPGRNPPRARRSDGFTIIELITCIVLLAIISVGTSSRWFESDAFKINAATAQFVSYSRLAQRIAMANRTVLIHLQIAKTSGNWQFSIIEDDSSVLTTLHQVQVEADGINFAVTAGIGPTDLSTAASLDIEYDALGNIVDVLIGAAQGTTANGVLVNVSGTSQQSICISPVGFSHDGVCV